MSSRPFQSSADTKMEFFNEFMVTLYLYATMLLTDFVHGLPFKVYASYVMLGVMGLTALVNAILVGAEMYKSAKEILLKLI